MPIPSLPSSQVDSPLGSSGAMYGGSDTPSAAGDSQGSMPGDQALQQKQSSFISQHKQLTSTLQSMAQGFPEFAPAAGKMLAISKQGLVEALGAMSKQSPPETPSGGFLS